MRISTQLDISDEDQARDHGIQPTCKAFLEEVVLLACGWRELEKSAKTLAIQLKSSRCAEEEERNAYAVLRNRIETSKHSKRKVLSSIVEDIRTVSRNTELLHFRRATKHTHTKIQYDRI